MNDKSTFSYFAIAGVIGSFHVVNDRGWLWLIPFWIVIYIGSKIIDRIIK